MSVTSELPEIAVVTTVRDEATMLPRWVEHYSAQAGSPDRLLVLDDGTTDGSTDDLPCPVIRLPERSMQKWNSTRLKMLSGISAGLLRVHDAVIFADADEFLVADPDKYATLRELVADRPHRDVLGGQALNVVHHVGTEPPLDPTRPVLAQRSLAKFVPRMCKPAVKRVPARWVLGSHGILADFEVDPDLYMFHMKFADRGHLVEAAAHRQRLTETEDRGHKSTWAHGQELVELLDSIVDGVDPAQVAPYELPEQERRELVVRVKRGHRAGGEPQGKAMARQPLVRVPDRFRGSC